MEPTLGLRHLALWVKDLEACVAFYVDVLGMKIEWQPDSDNVYLTSGNDNLALHRAALEPAERERQRLDHFGFILASPDQVDAWHQHFLEKKVDIKAPPRTHRTVPVAFMRPIQQAMFCR